ncbi:hypothetical protein [Streptomyces sp. NPDC093261]|uniref:hypothetical protein n=1 Tax=Streptomyces sp. NPDC093261 TaxID=3366037 RepID=UPI003826E078
MIPDRNNPAAPAAQTSEPPGRQRRRGWPDPASPVGAVMYAFLGGMAFWLLMDVVVRHVHIYWR